uniref:Uncharacterized protein n=1 Tax=Timema monikensis TaxID=170555 RepID=A0A7R9ECH9_9NEOP|nr:unnamed protein product [Timema monikensis]
MFSSLISPGVNMSYRVTDVSTQLFRVVMGFPENAGNGKFHYILLFVCGIGQIALVFELYLSSYLLPAAQCDFQMTAQEKGLLNSISYAVLRHKKRHICSPGAVVYAYVGEFYNNIERPTGIVLVSVFLPIGTLALPGLAWGVIPQTWIVTLPWCSFNSWRIFVVFCAIPSLVGGIIIYLCLPESPKFLMNQGNKEEALKVLRHVFVVNTGNDPGDYMVRECCNLRDKP